MPPAQTLLPGGVPTVPPAQTVLPGGVPTVTPTQSYWEFARIFGDESAQILPDPRSLHAKKSPLASDTKFFSGKSMKK